MIIDVANDKSSDARAMSQPTRVPMISKSPTQLQCSGRVFRERLTLQIEMAHQLDHPARRGAVELQLGHCPSLSEGGAMVVALVDVDPTSFVGGEAKTRSVLINQVAVDGQAHILPRQTGFERLA